MTMGVDLLPGLLMGGLASTLFGKKQNQPIPMAPPMIKLPDPTPPPRAPLSPSLTAGPQRAKAQSGGAMGNSDIVLSSTRSRNEDAGVARTTLLGA